jgi:hypothetical protein
MQICPFDVDCAQAHLVSKVAATNAAKHERWISTKARGTAQSSRQQIFSWSPSKLSNSTSRWASLSLLEVILTAISRLRAVFVLASLTCEQTATHWV